MLAKQLLDGTTSESRIAVVSAPSVFVQLKNLLVSGFDNEKGWIISHKPNVHHMSVHRIC